MEQGDHNTGKSRDETAAAYPSPPRWYDVRHFRSFSVLRAVFPFGSQDRHLQYVRYSSVSPAGC